MFKNNASTLLKWLYVQERYILDHYPIVHGLGFRPKTGKLIDLNIDFEEILKIFKSL